MKQWTVYFRDKNGSKASVVIEAEDRSGVFAELKKRGISAISVSEGASNKKPRKAASSGAPSKGRGLIAAAIVVLVAGIAAWWMMKGEEKVVEEKKVEETEKDRPVVAKITTKGTNSHQRIQVAKVNRVQGINDGNKVAQTNESHLSYGPEDMLKQALAMGKRPIFKYQSDVWLSQFVEPGVRVPPIPMSISKEDFLKSILDPIRIEDDDTDEEREIKESVKAMRQEAVEYIKSGGDFEGYMKELSRRQDREADLVSEAKAIIVSDFRDNGNLENSVELVREVNKKLEVEGLRKMKLPVPIKIKMVKQGIKIPEDLK